MLGSQQGCRFRDQLHRFGHLFVSSGDSKEHSPALDVVDPCGMDSGLLREDAPLLGTVLLGHGGVKNETSCHISPMSARH